MNYTGKNGEYFEVVNITAENCSMLNSAKPNELSLLWFTTNDNKLTIDAIPHQFNTNDITCFTEFYNIETTKINGLKLLRFNKPFYCIINHDSEVGCKGLLYYGSSNLPIIKPSSEDLEVLEPVWKLLCLEMDSKDELQLEMLQMMLKRILILCTRIYKSQTSLDTLENSSTDLIRYFNFLVETHFKQKHGVAEYAELLNKSPKTLSNLFKKIGHKTPLQFIQERLMLESRRLLRYSNKSISEIGYEIGFNDVQSFSRFFKNKEGISPLDFRIT
jgi:AraC family transcriptional activator of pobA